MPFCHGGIKFNQSQGKPSCINVQYLVRQSKVVQEKRSDIFLARFNSNLKKGIEIVGKKAMQTS